MREILFRAKSKNYRLNARDKHWVYGSLVRGEVLFPEKKEEYFIVELSNRGDCTYEVEPETICQYTGMNDKNGNKIWENDIVSINTYSYTEPEEDYFGKVVYAEGWACWCIQQPDDEKPIPLCECEGSYQTDRFVEGNIFDNPELLKEQ